MAPIICHLHKLGFVEAVAVPQTKVFEAGVQFARTEGIITGPEPCHDLRVAIDEALKCKEEGKSKTILIALAWGVLTAALPALASPGTPVVSTVVVIATGPSCNTTEAIMSLSLMSYWSLINR
jgi:hypothetical protein